MRQFYEYKLYCYTLVLALHCYCGDNIKYDLFRNTPFKQSNSMAVGKALRVTVNIKYSVFQLSH